MTESETVPALVERGAPVPTTPPRSAVMTRVGNHDYPTVTHRDCKVCMSPYRLFIENELLRGTAYLSIARQVQEVAPGSLGGSKANEKISFHLRDGHLVNPIETRRRIQEKRAEQIGIDIMGEGSIIDHMTVVETVIQRGYERLVEGQIEPTMTELLTAARMKQQIEETSPQGYDTEVFQAAFLIFFQTVQRYLDPGEFQAFNDELNRNPVLQALIARAEGGQQPSVAGEVEDPDEM